MFVRVGPAKNACLAWVFVAKFVALMVQLQAMYWAWHVLNKRECVDAAGVSYLGSLFFCPIGLARAHPLLRLVMDPLLDLFGAETEGENQMRLPPEVGLLSRFAIDFMNACLYDAA